jgi:hypothetical protein
MAVIGTLLSLQSAVADTIVFEGQRLENVYIRESPELYYVEIPATGEEKCVRKSQIKPEHIEIGKNDEAREALHKKWKEKQRPRQDPRVSIMDLDMVKPDRPNVPQPSDDSRGIVERSLEVNHTGEKSLTLRGTDFYDPVARAEQEAAEIDRHLQRSEERAAEAAEQAAFTAQRKQQAAIEGQNRESAMQKEYASDRRSGAPLPTSNSTIYGSGHRYIPSQTIRNGTVTNYTPFVKRSVGSITHGR